MTWFHGSPLRLVTLATGSTITRDRDVARVFSHKPTIVARDDDGRLSHNGTGGGFLYEVLDVVEADVAPHTETTMDAGVEWLTSRPLALRLLEPTAVLADEFLTEDEQRTLREQAVRRDSPAG